MGFDEYISFKPVEQITNKRTVFMSEFSRNLAFIIGINNYTNGISPLQNAVNDVNKLVKILREKHEYEVWEYLDEVATLKELNQLLEKTLPEQVSENDRLLFYFAGHGIALNGDDGPAGYLIPQDAKLNAPETYLPMTKLQESLEKLPCRHFLGILDCCFAGAFRWSSTRDLLTAPQVIHQERYDRFIIDPAWQVITSAASDQKALDAFNFNAERRQGGNHSPFAAALIEALAGKADIYPPSTNGKPPGDGVITATELYLYLRDAVEPATVEHRQRQTPGIWPLKKHDKGEYIFLSPEHPLNLPPAPPLDASKNPYRGLESYDEEHSELFFGRTELVEKLQNFVKTHPLTVVLGASGSGKSSLVPNAIDIVRERNILRGHDGWVISVALSPNGKYIATGSQDSTVRLWSIKGDKGELLHIFKGHRNSVNSVAFSPDGKYIVSGSADFTVKLWLIEGRRLLKTLPLRYTVNSVSFSPSSDGIITGSSDGTVQLWSTEGERLRIFRGNQGSDCPHVQYIVKSVAFSSDGQYIVSGGSTVPFKNYSCDDSMVRLWTVEGKLLKTFKGHYFGVNSVTFSPNGKYIISGSQDHTLRLWLSNTGDLLSTKEHEAGVTSVSFSRDGNYIVSSSFDSSSRLWTVVHNKDLVELAAFRGNEGIVNSVAITPDNNTLISGGNDSTVRVWSRQGQPSRSLVKDETQGGLVDSVAFSPDGQYIVGGNYNSTIGIWNLQGTFLYNLIGHKDRVNSVTFSPNSVSAQ